MESFNELNLSAPLMRALEELSFVTPSPIQAQTLPLLLGAQTDFIGLAATGTGKTAAFSIPLLERIDRAVRKVQAIVLCPTRELALQVSKQVDLLGKYSSVHALPIYGGSGYRDQLEGLRRGAQVVVGTPGRIIDHIESGALDLSGVHTVVLDEADEMISMGFREELEKILARTPRETSNIWLFSATMSPQVRKVADVYLRQPRQVQVNRSEMLSQTVEQIYYFTKESMKPEIICKIIDTAPEFYGIIFCQTKMLVTDLTQYLIDHGYAVDCLHGDKDQKSRERTMQAFRDHKAKVLVCTDVASRGLDVKDVTHVINYSLPRELDSYVHRIGRTARSGSNGVAISLVTPSQKSLLIRIERMTKSKIDERKVPSRREVNQIKITGLVNQFLAQGKFSEAAKSLMDEKWTTALAALTPQEVAARFLSLMLPDLFAEREVMSSVREPTPERTTSRGGPRPYHRERKGPPSRHHAGGERSHNGSGAKHGGGGSGPRGKAPHRFSKAPRTRH